MLQVQKIPLRKQVPKIIQVLIVILIMFLCFINALYCFFLLLKKYSELSG
ncbi:unnamed protein product [Tenebrio molitor]|nr:unnamed protein product [Tenebrio molitor]